MASPTVNVESVTDLLNDCLSKFGFEVYAMKIGWYNEVLPPSLRLPYPDDTLATVVLSTPSMFELAFLPFMENSDCHCAVDPIDQCVKHYIQSAISQRFPRQNVDAIYDYEMLPSRMPKFLAQTAAHVSGAAFYYRQTDVSDHPWGKKKMFGVCVHPKFGGWFAIRALLVFRGVVIGSEFVKPTPSDCVPSREDRIRLLEGFNLCWKDWSYRSIMTPVETYSELQRNYFSTPPAQRFALLKTWGLLQKEDNQEYNQSHTQIQANGHG